MNSPKKRRGKQIKVEILKSPEDKKIEKLVVRVRERQDESAFLKLREYLSFYMKLFGSRYRIPGCDSDEIEQECLFALRYKAIEDFKADRGKFRSFAILCIRRHLFSIIKGNNQHKRRVLNESLSLNEDRSENSGESLSLIDIVEDDRDTADDILAREEIFADRKRKLIEHLSGMEKEVLYLYLQQMHYDEMVVEMRKILPDKKINRKTIDNSLTRVRQKAQELAEKMDFEE